MRHACIISGGRDPGGGLPLDRGQTAYRHDKRHMREKVDAEIIKRRTYRSLRSSGEARSPFIDAGSGGTCAAKGHEVKRQGVRTDVRPEVSWHQMSTNNGPIVPSCDHFKGRLGPSSNMFDPAYGSVATFQTSDAAPTCIDKR